jgi:hypothetical protein
MNDYKSIAGLLVILLVIVGCTQVSPETANTSETLHKADLFFENGIIYTVDREDTIAQTLAVKDGKIIFVGSTEEGQSYKKGATEVVDIQGGMLLPGFIDGHIHTITPEFFDFTLLGDRDVDSVLKTVAEYVNAHPDQSVYYGYGVNVGIFEGEELAKGPKKERLDAISSDKPIIIYALDGHSVWLNSKGFEYCNITKDTASPPGGEIVKDNTGELWGTITNSAMALVPDPLLSGDKLSLALRNFLSHLSSLGYTAMMTLPGNGFLEVPWDGFQQLEQQGLLHLRVRGASIIRPWEFEEDFARLKEVRAKYDSDLVKLTAAKVFADGILADRSAYLLQPYNNTTDHYGEAIWTQEALNNAYAVINKAGVQIHTHAIGDAATRMALDAAEYVRSINPGLDSRNAITHLQLVATEDFMRFGELGVLPVVQAFWHFKQPGAWEPIEYPVLGERANTEWPLKSFVDYGGILTFSSDYPVTNVPHPFYAIEIAVTRNLPDGPAYGASDDITDMDDPKYLLWPEERLDIKKAIRAYTVNAAYSLFVEDIVGTLEVGKSADLIVIDQDLFSIEPLKISDTRVLRTYLNGKLVYSRSE